MRAVRVTGPGDVALGDVPDPVPVPGEVLVEVVASAVCGTDRKLAATYAGPEARIPGHEVTAATVDGTPVGVHPEVACGSCPACQDGWQNRCPSRRALGLARDGGLAQRLAVPPEQLLPLAGLDPVTATMLEPLACAVHAVETSGIRPGAPAVVVGAGTMGILCTWVLQAAGCRVVVCQRSPARRSLARELGAEAVIGPDQDPQEYLGQPPAAVVVTPPGSGPLRWALERVAPGGVVHAFAGTPGGAELDVNVVHYRHLRLVGSSGSRMRDYQRARDLVAGGLVPLDRLPHRVVDLSDAPAALREPPPDGVLKTVVRCAAAPGDVQKGD